jgi:hypothetical protein
VKRVATLVAAPWIVALVLASCSSGSDGDEGTPTGGSGGAGGAPGASGGATASRGGNPTSGGTPEGGVTSGGKSSGGGSAATGGSNAGGQAGEASPNGGKTSGGSSGGSGGNDPGSGKHIEVRGRELYVDGEPFRIRGVNWNPVPKGGEHPANLDYAGFADQDIALMKAAGINVVRTYERLENRAVLDKLEDAGIYVFSTVYGWWQDAPSVVTARVNAVKDHPAILAWVLGNEWNYNHLYANDSLSLEATRDQINEAAELIRAADDEHPISTIYGELGGIEAQIAGMPNIDLWGVNAYRGISFGDLFTQFAAASTKPMYLGEYGADAYDSRNGGKVDVDAQGVATKALTEEIIDNYATPSGGTTLGGFVFEWADEWWKGGNPDSHDTGGIAPGGGPYPDQTFNEEYWGVVDIDRVPRPAYDELKALYAP